MKAVALLFAFCFTFLLAEAQTSFDSSDPSFVKVTAGGVSSYFTKQPVWVRLNFKNQIEIKNMAGTIVLAVPVASVGTINSVTKPSTTDSVMVAVARLFRVNTSVAGSVDVATNTGSTGTLNGSNYVRIFISNDSGGDKTFTLKNSKTGSTDGTFVLKTGTSHEFLGREVEGVWHEPPTVTYPTAINYVATKK